MRRRVGLLDNMLDLASSSAGAKIALATSGDEEFPPENIIDGNKETFWVTTGLFPQEFVLTFPGKMSINLIKIFCHNVKELIIEKSSSSELKPKDFEYVAEAKLENQDGEIQQKDFDMRNALIAQQLKIIIKAGHDCFASVHKLQVNGTAVEG